MKYAYLMIMVLATLLILGCAPGTQRFEKAEAPAGFFWGIWHGWIAPVSLVWQIFDPKVRIYETKNTGIWYDLGFYIAIIGGFGGFAFSRSGKKD